MQWARSFQDSAWNWREPICKRLPRENRGETKIPPDRCKPLTATVTLRRANIRAFNPCYIGLVALTHHDILFTRIGPFKHPELAKTLNSPEKNSNTYEKHLRSRNVELPFSGFRSCNKAESPSSPIPWATRAYRRLKLRVVYFLYWKGSRRIEYLAVLSLCEVERVAF